jgi:hypothetical protein
LAKPVCRFTLLHGEDHRLYNPAHAGRKTHIARNAFPSRYVLESRPRLAVLMSTLPPLTGSSAPDFSHVPPRKPSGKVWIWSGAATLIILLFFAWECGSAFLSEKKLADAAVQHFHQQLNAGQYEEIFGEAADGFVTPATHDDTVKFLSGVHAQLGDAGAASLAGLNINTSTGEGTTLTCSYNTVFAHGSAAETFTWKKNGSTLKLYGYNIQSTVTPSN